MNLKRFKNVLEELDSIGIKKVVFAPQEKDESTLIKGTNEKESILVFYEYPEVFSEYPIGIASARALLSRINLFDIDKASVQLVDDTEYIDNFVIKQGKRKVNYICSSVDHMRVPKKLPSDGDNILQLDFSTDYVNYLSKVITSIMYTAGDKEASNINLHTNKGNVNVQISDGENDSFSDEFEAENDAPIKGAWELSAFQRVMKQSSSSHEEGNAAFRVGESGICTFSLKHTEAIVVPSIV